MRRALACVTMLLLLTALLPAAAIADGSTARVVVDGIELRPEVPPMLLNNRTMVPFRAIAEAMGVKVEWEGTTQTILATSQGKSLRLVVGQQSALVNGEVKTFDVAPQIVNGRTLVPIRLFGEAFGAKVTWEPETRTANVRSAVRPLRSLAFYGLSSYEWRRYIPRFSDVAYTWSSVTPDGQLSLDQNEYFWPMGAEEVLQMAQDTGVGRFLTVIAGDGDDRLTKLVLNPQARERLALQIQQVVAEHRLEGVVIDLEGLGFGLTGADLAAVRRGFVALVQQVKEPLAREQQEVIVAVPPLNGWYPGYDYKAIAQVADQLLIMAYEYNPPASTEPEPLSLVEEAVLLTLQEIPAEKVLLGLLVEHETGESVMQKVALAKRHNLSGIATWILRLLDEDELQAIETLITPKK